MGIHFGDAAKQALAAMTGSPTHSGWLQAAERPIDGPPTTAAECAALREWADNLPAQRPIAASNDQLAKHLSFMAATLPSKNIDDDGGKMRAAVYCKLLEGHSNEALAYMARTACETLDWFPTPKQCLSILEQYRTPDSPRAVALQQCHTFTQRQFEDWIALLKAGDASAAAINSVPDRWRRIAYEQDVLRRLPDGSYALRTTPLSIVASSQIEKSN